MIDSLIDDNDETEEEVTEDVIAAIEKKIYP